MRLTRLTTLMATAFLSLATNAHAGTYTVHACTSNGVNRAFWAYANPGLSAFAQCPGVDYRGETTGLVARAEQNAGGGRLGLHASAWHIFEAPPGASLQSMSFRVSAGRASGCWAMGVWGWSGDSFHPGDHLWGYGADCGAAGGGFTYFVGPVALDLGGRQKVRLGVRCDAAAGCPTNAGVGTWTSLKDIAVTVRDDTAPAMALRSGALLGGGWHRGTESAWGDFADNVGIRQIYGQLEDVSFSYHDFTWAGWPAHKTCDYARPQPCPPGLDAGVTVDTARVPDGARRLRVVAIDAAGNPAILERTIRVDNHAPAPPRGAEVPGGQDWRRANGFDVAWANPPDQVAPIVRAHWRLCRAAGTAECRTGSRDTASAARLDGIEVPESGDWIVAVWLEDEAGNVDAGTAADPVHLRLDAVAPETPGFDAPDPADPRRLALPVSDRHSGIAEARVELRPRGGGAWRVLRTGLESDGRAVAHVPDTELPDGPYDVRALLRDRAGNEAVAATDRTGRPMTVVLPLRDATRFAATVRKPLRVAFGRSARLSGVLQTWRGRPVGGAAFELHERPRTQAEWRRVTTATTDATGRFTVPVAAGPSRTLRVAYAGDGLLLPAALEARVLVPARGTLRASRHRARNGGRVVFSGRLVGAPLPRGGRTIDLQAHYRGAWRTFATPRTDARGRWRQPYRFGATRGRVGYRFRAAIKRDAAYPYEYAVTRTVRVIVTG